MEGEEAGTCILTPKGLIRVENGLQTCHHLGFLLSVLLKEEKAIRKDGPTPIFSAGDLLLLGAIVKQYMASALGRLLVRVFQMDEALF